MSLLSFDPYHTLLFCYFHQTASFCRFSAQSDVKNVLIKKTITLRREEDHEKYYNDDTVSIFNHISNPINNKLPGDPEGNLIDDNAYDMIFALYDGSTQVWSESHSGVDINGGVFNVILGSINTMDISFDSEYSLGINVSGDDMGNTSLTSVPYSMHSKESEKVGDFTEESITQIEIDAASAQATANEALTTANEALALGNIWILDNGTASTEINVVINNDLNVMGDVDVMGNSSVTGILNITGNSYLGNDLSVMGNTNVNGVIISNSFSGYGSNITNIDANNINNLDTIEGPQGADGLDGAQGLPGADGSDGATGPQGVRLVHKDQKDH